MEILACPMCKHYPLELHIFKENDEISEGIITCSSCSRWYPIIEEIPHMLPDELRDANKDRAFLKKWKEKIPENTLKEGKPFKLKSE
jgi:uncharacterized protein YbaR (Trm112 family)